MIARLLLALLLAMFTMPAATASGGCPARALSHHALSDQPGGAPVTPAHVCIGCIPPDDWTATMVATPYLPREISVSPRAVRVDIGRSAPPALPPPRHG